MLEDVFGVSRPVLSFVQRKSVDDRFQVALKADKQIVLHRSSKQGKTALVQTYLPYDMQGVACSTDAVRIVAGGVATRADDIAESYVIGGHIRNRRARLENFGRPRSITTVPGRGWQTQRPVEVTS